MNPVTMIAPATGLAPMGSLILERAWCRREADLHMPGSTMLISGGRNKPFLQGQKWKAKRFDVHVLRASSEILTQTPATQSGGADSPKKALEIATERFVKANPKSKEVFEYASKHLPAGNTRTSLFAPPFPVSVVRGSGSDIVSADGRVYLDMLGEYSAGIYGHSHPEIIGALQKGLTKGVNFGATGPPEGELAGLIKQRFEDGAGLQLLRFTNSGTEANLMAITTAKVWTGGKKVLVFTSGYHGSGINFHGKHSEPNNISEEYLIAEYNSISSVEDILQKHGADSIAAILLEPMQGGGGCLPGSKKFLSYLREKATELGALLIFDEVMTSRLHYAGGLSGKYGIKPDLITMGKYLGGGMSFGVFGGRKDIMSLFDPRTGGHINGSQAMMLTHSGTFNNNLMTMRAGIAGAKLLTPQVFEYVNGLGDYLRGRITDMLIRQGVLPQSAANFVSQEEPDIDTVVRGNMWMSGIGSINCLHFGRNDELADLKDLFYFHLLENEIYMSRRGFTTLNVVHTKEDIDRFCEIAERFVERWNGVVRDPKHAAGEWEAAVAA